MYIMLSRMLGTLPGCAGKPESGVLSSAIIPSHAQVSAAKSSLGLLTEAGFKHPGVKSFKLNPTLARYVRLKLHYTEL